MLTVNIKCKLHLNSEKRMIDSFSFNKMLVGNKYYNDPITQAMNKVLDNENDCPLKIMETYVF